MFSKIFPWAFFFHWMPYPRRFGFLGQRFVFRYNRYFEAYEKAVIKYHKAQLLQLDSSFRVEENLKKLTRMRMDAKDRGVDPMSSEYPSYSDVSSTD